MLKSERLYRVLLVLGSVAFGLGILQLLSFAEIVDYRTLLSPQRDRMENTDVTDRELLHVHPPHFHIKGTAVGGEVTGKFQIPRSDMTTYQWDLRYDQNGFRNDRDLTSADIALIGDSFVENMTTPSPEQLSSRVAQFQGKVVANLGQYGYGPCEELAVLRRYALPLHPRTVIWMFYEANDLKDVIHWQNDGRRSGIPWVPDPGSQPSFIHNALAQVHAQLKRALRPAGRTRAGTVTLANGQNRTVYFNYASLPYTQNDLKALDETGSVLATAEKLSHESGARFLFVFIPMKFRAYRQSCRFSAESECRNWVLTDMPERLRKAVGPTSSDVGYLDLTPDLAAAVKRGILPYYTDDDHWSSVGQGIAAEAISRSLAAMSAH